MADCALIETCIFFNDKMADMPGMANLYKQRYCREDSASCARYTVFEALGRENVPTDLFPNDLARANGIVAG